MAFPSLSTHIEKEFRTDGSGKGCGRVVVGLRVETDPYVICGIFVHIKIHKCSKTPEKNLGRRLRDSNPEPR